MWRIYPQHWGSVLVIFGKRAKIPEDIFVFTYKTFDVLANKYMYLYQTGSVKHKRLNLVHDFYKLKKQKAHLPNTSPALAKLWEALIRKWYSFDSLLLINNCQPRP